MSLEREWGSRERRKCTSPSKCRSCRADVLWVTWLTSGKKMPIDAVPDMREVGKGGGTIVVAMRGGEYGELIAEKYDPAQHDAKRNRFTSHFSTCPEADQHRRLP